MKSAPFSFDYRFSPGAVDACDTHLVRRLSVLGACFADKAAWSEAVAKDDVVAYEVYEIRRPEVAGEMLSGFSILHPGLVGDEFFMTKGHFHSVRDTAEFYFCLNGHGMLVMENAEGATAVEELRPGRAVYVNPGWAHRSVNLSLEEDFVTFFVYPANAGHDYATIETSGFRKRVVLKDGRPQVIDNRPQQVMYFIGVTTGKSSIMSLFPLWAAELGRPATRLEGIDLPLHAAPETYRQAVERIKNDASSLGALVTSHKINLLDAARDLFDTLDPFAQICGEVSSISKSGALLAGHAKDPITSGKCLDTMLKQNYFARTGGEVLCIGAGGSTTAIILHLVNKKEPGDRPGRIVVVNRSPGRIEQLRRMVGELSTGIRFEFHCHTDPLWNDALMAQLAPCSLVINATGMGKDLPGSPITNQGLFPPNGIAWELNYRGELDFLHQALAQQQARNLTVEDGWLYFLYGWTEVIAEVLKVDIGGDMFSRLAAIAARQFHRSGNTAA